MLLILLALGCPDPLEGAAPPPAGGAVVEATAAPGTPRPEDAVPPPPGEGVAPMPGGPVEGAVAAAPVPGGPTDGATASVDGAPTPADGAPVTLPPTPVHPGDRVESGGSGVSVSGSIAYAGSKKGTLRVDFLRTAMGSPPELVGSMTVKAAGPFKVDVPASLGTVRITAYLDANGDGPTQGEPQGFPAKDSYEIGTTPITGVDITLTDDFKVSK